MNALEALYRNTTQSEENLTAAESRIRDADLAKEIMEYTKTSILSQASDTILAQVNKQSEAVLQLLR